MCVYIFRKNKVTKGLQSWEIFRIGIGLFGADPVHPGIFETAILENPVCCYTMRSYVCIILHIIHVTCIYNIYIYMLGYEGATDLLAG